MMDADHHEERRKNGRRAERIQRSTVTPGHEQRIENRFRARRVHVDLHGHPVIEFLRIAPFDEVTGFPVAHDHAQAADGRRDDRRPAGRRFQRHQPERFGRRGNDDNVRRAVELRQFAVTHGLHEAKTVRHAETARGETQSHTLAATPAG